MLFTSGRGSFISQSGEDLSLDGGDLVILRRGDGYRFTFPEGTSYVTSAFGFDGESE